MEWVHCNSCYVQPAPGRKDLAFCLTSCGHIFCTKCQGKDTCAICKTKCSVVSLSKQLMSDVKVYFSNPISLFEKLAVELERVYMFQKNQRERLFKHRKEMVQLKTQKLFSEIQILEKEVKELEKQLHSVPTFTNPSSQTTDSRPVHVPYNHQNVLTPKVALHNSEPGHASNIQLSQSYHPPSVRPVTHPIPTPDSRPLHYRSPYQYSNSQAFPSRSASLVPPPPQFYTQPHSHAHRPQTATPSNVQLRVMQVASQGRRPETPLNRPESRSPSIILTKRPRTNTMSSTPIGPTRLCIRTPPIDGKIGIIPGSNEAILRHMVSPHGHGRGVARFSPLSAGRPPIYTPNSYGYSPSQLHHLCKRRPVFPDSITPNSQSRLSPPPHHIWSTPNTINGTVLARNPRKTQ